MLADPDPAVRERAARAWCHWESATSEWPPTTDLAPRFRDPAYATAYARLVTHYARHDGWLGDGRVLQQVGQLAGIPGILVNGRFDFQAPIGTAWRLHRAWPASELVIVDNAGHKPGVEITSQLIKATNHFRGSES
jgi:proline iminopeptidase